MSWMRASIGVGGVGLLAGIAGMLLWINDGSNYFGVAVALASAGFLTLVACKLTSVFGSSHGSQDDAFRRGREMGYDAGYLDGRRTARPVVVPMLHVVGGDKGTPAVPRDHEMPLVARDQQMPGVARDHELRAIAHDQEMRRRLARDQHLPGAARDQQLPVTDTGLSDSQQVGGLRFAPPILPVWRREASDEVVGWDRVVAWMRPRRIPLLAGVVSLALVGVVLIGAAMARPSTPVEALRTSAGPGSLFDRTAPSQGETPAPVLGPSDPGASVPVVAGASPLAIAKVGLTPAVLTADANGGANLGTNGAVLLALAPTNLAGIAVAPAIDPLTAVTPPTVKPVVVPPVVVPPVVVPPVVVPPVVVPPVVPLTAAEQTAADALAAANLTKANAKAAADLTAANAKAAADLTAATAKAAADLTAANAAAAAAATAQAAAGAAWAVAHP